MLKRLTVQDLTIESVKSLNGWLAPDGTFFQCPRIGCHGPFAVEVYRLYGYSLEKDKELIHEGIPIEPCCRESQIEDNLVFIHNWVKIRTVFTEAFTKKDYYEIDIVANNHGFYLTNAQTEFLFQYCTYLNRPHLMNQL